MKKLLYSLCFVPSVLWTQAPKFSNDFLNIGVGARGLAMGTAASASTNNVQAAYWNPAGLVTNDARFQVGIQHAEWYSGIGNYDYLGFGKSIGAEKKAFGSISVIRMSIDKIPNTLRIRGPDGSINYDRIEEFSVADYAFLISYGRQLKAGPWSIGGNVKVIHRAFGTFARAWGFGIDLGLLYYSERLSFSLMGRDIVPTFNAYSFSFTEEEKAILQQTGNAIPSSSLEYTLPKLIAGMAYRIPMGQKMGFMTALDAEFSFDGTASSLLRANRFNLDPRIGMELDFNQVVFIRMGASNFQNVLKDDGSNEKTFSFYPSGGLGIKVGRVCIDYALTNIGRTGIGEYSHYFSLILDF